MDPADPLVAASDPPPEPEPGQTSQTSQKIEGRCAPIEDDPGAQHDEAFRFDPQRGVFPRTGDARHLRWAIGRRMAFVDDALPGVAVDRHRAHLKAERRWRGQCLRRLGQSSSGLDARPPETLDVSLGGSAVDQLARQVEHGGALNFGRPPTDGAAVPFDLTMGNLRPT